jgi:hypothetical protein
MLHDAAYGRDRKKRCLVGRLYGESVLGAIAIKMFNKLMKVLSYWYLQYELVTCIYVFEPWEKKLLSILLCTQLL